MSYRVVIFDSEIPGGQPLVAVDFPATTSALQLVTLQRLITALVAAPIVEADLADFNAELDNLSKNLNNVANAVGNDGTRAMTAAVFSCIASENIDATNAQAVTDLLAAIEAETDVSDVVTAINAL